MTIEDISEVYAEEESRSREKKYILVTIEKWGRRWEREWNIRKEVEGELIGLGLFGEYEYGGYVEELIEANDVMIEGDREYVELGIAVKREKEVFHDNQ